MSCEKCCNCDFDSQIAYLIDDNNKQIIMIVDFLKDKEIKKKIKNKEFKLVCENNNELISYESNKKKSHFKHKNCNYCGMSEWHKNWQNEFEIKEKQIGNRIADAIVFNTVIEFQHSKISEKIVKLRNENYEKYNKNLIWIIDCCGENDLEVKQINDKCFTLKFNKNEWKYKSFFDNEYIYLDFNNKIFRINPNYVKSGMINVQEFKTREEFIKLIKNGTNIWYNDELVQCTIYHNQRGAGCGKTYESIQLLDNEKFKQKKYFIYLTKMHSAKEVIYNELIGQYENGKLENLNKPIECDDMQNSKQYKISFDCKDKRNIQIIIGTIDSFIYSIGNKKVVGNNFFAEIVNCIKEGFTDISKNNILKYAQLHIPLNKECIIIIDEAQDLNPNYIEALSKIMEKTYIDVYIIGDKLQSLWGAHNIHTYLEQNNLPIVTIERNIGKNHVMRFHNIQFINFVNDIIKFDKYNLPKIEKICEVEKCKYVHENDKKPCIVEYIKHDNNYYENCIEYINKIINYIEIEITNNNYLPNNFMFIFPILSNKKFPVILESKLQEFWIKKFNDKEYYENVVSKNNFWKEEINKNTYNKFVFIHKSNEGTSINLKESENSSRILSIHASKGVGCEVVFLLELSDFSLKIYSDGEENLIYESLLHVALTRQKKKLYIQITTNAYHADKIERRFKSIDPNNEKIPLFSKNLKIEKCLINSETFFNNFIKPNNFNELINEDNNENRNIIEWGHHLIRYYVFYYYIFYGFINKGFIKDDKSLQFIVKCKKIVNYSIKFHYSNEYYKLFKINEKNKNNKLIPILRLTNNNIYYKYENIIIQFIKKIQEKLKNSLINNKLSNFCALECIIFWHLFDIIDLPYVKLDITIMDIYTLIYYFDECSSLFLDLENDIHTCTCLCRKLFIKYSIFVNKYQNIRESIFNHYKVTKSAFDSFSSFVHKFEKKYEKLNNFQFLTKYSLNYSKKSDLTSKKDFFIVRTQLEFFGYSDKYVINILIKPEYSLINYNEIITKLLFQHFLITRSNEEKFKNKKIITCILTLKSINPILIEFNLTEEQNVTINNIIKYVIIKKCEDYNLIFDKYLKYYNFDINNFNNSLNKINNEIKQIMEEMIKIQIKFEDLYIKYFVKFIKKLKNDAKYSQENNLFEKFIEKINNDKYFINELNKYTNKSVEKFIGY